MGLFEKLWGKKEGKVTSTTYYKMLDGGSPIFTPYNKSIYDTALIRSSIDFYARVCAKLKIQSTGPVGEKFEKILAVKPNTVMDTYKFLYRIATILSVENNVFLVPIYGTYESVIGIYPIVPQRCEIIDHNGIPYLKYTFANSQRAAIELDRVGIMNQFQYSNDLFGENNSVLMSILDSLKANDESNDEAMRNALNIKFIAKVSNVIKDDDIVKMKKNWSEANLTADNAMGVVMYDQRLEDLKQVDFKHPVPNKEYIDMLRNDIFSYFGTNDALLQNRFTEEEFNSYYTSKIEPFAIQLSLVLNNMLLSKREQNAGNDISLGSSRLQYMRYETKIALSTQMFDRGLVSINTVMDMWGMDHVKDGDKRYIRKEYAEIDQLTLIQEAEMGLTPKKDKQKDKQDKEGAENG